MNNMTIPQCRERLNEIAEELPIFTIAEAQEEIRKVIEQMYRRPAIRRASKSSRKMTPELHKDIVRMATTNPDMSYQDIGNFWGVSAGRVSEAVAGFRRSTPLPPAASTPNSSPPALPEGYLPITSQMTPPPPSPFYADRVAL